MQMRFSSASLLLVAWTTEALQLPRLPQRANHATLSHAPSQLAHAFVSVALAVGTACGGVGGVSPALAESAESASTAGFEEFAAQGGKMTTDPSCFFNQCGDVTKACFTNPSCLTGITCLGNCRGEQLCATQCFARFGSERLNSWLSCTLEEKECVTTGVKQDTSTFYANPPPAMAKFKPSDLEGEHLNSPL